MADILSADEALAKLQAGPAPIESPQAPTILDADQAFAKLTGGPQPRRTRAPIPEYQLPKIGVDISAQQFPELQLPPEAYTPEEKSQFLKDVSKTTPTEQLTYRAMLPVPEQTMADAVDTLKGLGSYVIKSQARGGAPSLAEEIGTPQREPTATEKVLSGLQKSGLGIADTLTQPEGIGLLALGGLPGLAGKAVSAGFFVDMIRHTPELARRAGEAIAKGDIAGETEALADLIVNSAFVLATGKHAATPKSALEFSEWKAEQKGLDEYAKERARYIIDTQPTGVRRAVYASGLISPQGEGGINLPGEAVTEEGQYVLAPFKPEPVSRTIVQPTRRTREPLQPITTGNYAITPEPKPGSFQVQPPGIFQGQNIRTDTGEVRETPGIEAGISGQLRNAAPEPLAAGAEPISPQEFQPVIQQRIDAERQRQIDSIKDAKERIKYEAGAKEGPSYEEWVKGRDLKDEVISWLLGAGKEPPEPTMLFRGVPPGSATVAAEGKPYVHVTPWRHIADRGGQLGGGGYQVLQVPAQSGQLYYRGGALAGDPLESTRIGSIRGYTWQQALQRAKVLFERDITRLSHQDWLESLSAGDRAEEIAHIRKQAAYDAISDFVRGTFESDIQNRPGKWREAKKIPRGLLQRRPELRTNDEVAQFEQDQLNAERARQVQAAMGAKEQLRRQAGVPSLEEQRALQPEEQQRVAQQQLDIERARQVAEAQRGKQQIREQAGVPSLEEQALAEQRRQQVEQAQQGKQQIREQAGVPSLEEQAANQPRFPANPPESAEETRRKLQERSRGPWIPEADRRRAGRSSLESGKSVDKIPDRQWENWSDFRDLYEGDWHDYFERFHAATKAYEAAVNEITDWYDSEIAKRDSATLSKPEQDVMQFLAHEDNPASALTRLAETYIQEPEKLTHPNDVAVAKYVLDSVPELHDLLDKREMGDLQKGFARMKLEENRKFASDEINQIMADPEIYSEYRDQLYRDEPGLAVFMDRYVHPRYDGWDTLESGKQILTPEFQNWFAGSKVVDENGQPLVVYHGTGVGDISAFKQSKEGFLGKGIYLTSDPAFASNYARENQFAENVKGGVVYPLYAKIVNPLVIERPSAAPAIDVMEKLGLTRQKASDIFEKALEEKGNLSGQIQAKAIKAGYDGLIIYRDGKPHEIVAFRPEQIKSAIGNQGTFDPTNPDILSRSDLPTAGAGELDHLLKPGVTVRDLLDEVVRLTPENKDLVESFIKAGINPNLRSVASLTSSKTGNQIAGEYNTDTDTIYLRRFTSDQIGTLLEEMVHAATVQAYQTNPEFKDEMGRILRTLRSKVADPDQFYYLRSELELMAGARVDPVTRRLLKSIRSEDQPNLTLWQRFVKLIKDGVNKLLGRKPGDPAIETALDRVLKLTQENFKPNEIRPKDIQALEAPITQTREEAEKVFKAKEAIEPGTGKEVLASGSAASSLIATPAVRRTVHTLKILADQPLTPGEIEENPALRDIQQAAQRVLKEAKWLSQEVEGMEYASATLGPALQKYSDYRNNPNVPEELKSKTLGDALDELDRFQEQYGKFRRSSVVEEDRIKKELKDQIENRDWQIASEEAAKSLTADLKEVGKQIAESAGDEGSLKVFVDQSSQTGALEKATAFISQFGDHNLIQQGVIRTTDDLVNQLNNKADQIAAARGGGTTREQVTQTNPDTLRYVADLVMQSEPYRQRIFEASDLFKTKAASYPLKPFMQQIAKYVDEGDYEGAIRAFGKGLGKTALELNQSRKAARLFGRAVQRNVIRLRELQNLRQLYNGVTSDPDFKTASDSVYNDANVASITHGIGGDKFTILPIRPGEKSVEIDFGSDAKDAEKNIENLNDFKERVADYLAHPEAVDYDPVKARGLKAIVSRMDIWANPTINPKVGRAVPNILYALPRTVFGLMGSIDQIPEVIHRYLGGFGADYSNATLSALASVMESRAATLNQHVSRLKIALAAAVKSHKMDPSQFRTWEERVWTPLAASHQYYENPLIHKAGSMLSTGEIVTPQDMAFMKAWRDFDKSHRRKLSSTDASSRSLMQRFRSGIVEEGPGGTRIREATETGPSTMPRRTGNIYDLLDKWKELRVRFGPQAEYPEAPNPARAIQFLNAHFNKLVAGYMEDSTGFTFKHTYKFGDEIKQAYLQRRAAGNPIKTFDDLVEEVTNRHNLSSDAPIERTDVALQLLREFDGLFRRLDDDREKQNNLKTHVKVFGSENAWNTARGEQLFPSTWYDYGSVGEADHAAYVATSSMKYYFEFVQALGVLHKELSTLVKDFEANPEMLAKGKKAQQEGTNFYDYDQAKQALKQVADLYNKMEAVLTSGNAKAAIGQHQGMAGAGIDFSISSILANPAAMIFNSFGGLQQIVAADMQMNHRSMFNAITRSGTRASWDMLKGLTAFMATPENKIGRAVRAISESGEAAPIINKFFHQFNEFLKKTDELREQARDEGLNMTSDLAELKKAMWDWKLSGGSAVESPPDQGTLGNIRQMAVALMKYGGRSVSNKSLRNIDAWINSQGQYLVNDMQADYEKRARKYGTLRVEAARREGRDPFDPTDLRNQFSADELVKAPGMVRNTAIEAAREREWLKRSSDINIDAKMLDYVRRREEAVRNGQNPDTVRLFTPQELNTLRFSTAARVNLGHFGNRPTAFKAGPVMAKIGLLLGYRMNQIYRMVGTLDGLQRHGFFKRHAYAMPAFVLTLVATAILGSLAMGGREKVKKFLNQATQEPTIFNAQNPHDMANALAIGASQMFPFYGDIYNQVSGNAYKSGWDLNSQFVMLNLGTDLMKMLKQTWQTGDMTYPSIAFARRWVAPFNWAGQFLPKVAGLQEITNTRNLLARAARGEGMETRFGKGNVSATQNYGPTTPLLNDFSNAVGKGDASGARAAYNSLVEFYTKQGLDPLEAQRRALSGIRTRNPLTQVFGAAITQGQLDALYARMTEGERKTVGRALANYEGIVSGIGGTTGLTKEARAATKAKRTAGRQKLPPGIAGRILGRSLRLGRTRNPLQRIYGRLGIRQPRNKKPKRTRSTPLGI